MTPADVRDRFQADLLAVDTILQSERPPGLTMSRLGWCTSNAVRHLAGHLPGAEEQDRYPAMRGRWTHDGIEGDLHDVNPGWGFGDVGTAGQRAASRVSWQPWPDLPPITGGFDIDLEIGGERAVVDIKSRTSDVCRWHARHGPLDHEAMQAAALATALGRAQAFACYVPTDGGRDEWAVCEVDVPAWAERAADWYRRAWENRDDVESAPREQPMAVCVAMCPFWRECRKDYHDPRPVIVRPEYREAARELWASRPLKKEAEERVRAAQAMLGRVEGVAPAGDGWPELSVRVVEVRGSADRAGYWWSKIDEERP